MANSRNNRTTPSASQNMNDVVDKYASPAMGSSLPEYSRQSYDPVLSRRGHGDVSMSSSPSPYPLSERRRANLHQSTSTHSGYLDRAQLFGRTPISIQHNARRARPSSTSNERNIRKRSSRTPTGEWAEAGLPEPPVEDRSVSLDVASGLICTPNGITTLDVDKNTPGRFSPKAQSPTSRKTSPAEDALREQFEKGRVELARNLAWRSSSNGKSRWAGRGFDTKREGYVAPKTPSVASDEEEEEFGYVDPTSVRDVLARVKAREATGRTQLPSDDMKRGRNGQEQRERYSDVGVPRRSKNALLANPSDPDKPLPKLPNRRVFSLVEPPPMKTLTRKRPSTASGRTKLSFSPITPAINVAPQPTRQDLAITPVSTYLSFSSFSSVTTTISQPPILPHNRTGLTFSQAIAIIYGCMAITASHQALLGLGGDIAAKDLIMGLYGAFMLGLAICVVLQVVLCARL
ncbi:uncharacterized protein J4E84_006278 [Alternaria hordeiaustralica]|uniref:uncharacterized protein n=1 Tax=Alternaria hordeiaustralica TaxID=1187925 RepID=UPI0020C37E63|nr:uncharacterized protein J4E84_006278 [Alternaria hordeiaustralica]KAI4684290.1 hypothetical protein J4E84_006278 [Alternaria hordeiaustralica]